MVGVYDYNHNRCVRERRLRNGLLFNGFAFTGGSILCMLIMAVRWNVVPDGNSRALAIGVIGLGCFVCCNFWKPPAERGGAAVSGATLGESPKEAPGARGEPLIESE